MQLPIVEHLAADPPTGLRKKTEELAETLLREHPELAEPGEFRDLVPQTLDDGPTLHLDDLSEISRLDPGEDVRFYQDRARLRAGDGDLVASCGDVIDGHEEYCRDVLGLASPQWLRPRPLQNRMRIAEACWEDDEIRRTLIAKLRRGELACMHPHMGTFAVWELAALLHAETGSPLKVIAPLPRLSRWVNNKVAFAETVRRLFGGEFVPRTESAWNTAILAQRVQSLAQEAEAIGLKLPDAGGGDGNIVLPTEPLRGTSLAEIEQSLKRAVAVLEWHGERELLVDIWEAEVLCSPSAQLWIPPERDGAPVVEGIFVQIIEGREGVFVGTIPAQFPADLNREIAERCWLLARLFQRLGYVGRCSFDLILIGKDLRDCRVEFIECNGRWGGTSLPMTLMNRIFGDWMTQPFAVQVFHHIEGLSKVALAGLLDVFERDLFDIRTKTGSLIFFNPGRLRSQSGISAILLGSSWEYAAGDVRQEFSMRLLELARNVK